MEASSRFDGSNVVIVSEYYPICSEAHVKYQNTFDWYKAIL
jgi:hypothetical protein